MAVLGDDPRKWRAHNHKGIINEVLIKANLQQARVEVLEREAAAEAAIEQGFELFAISAVETHRA